MPPCLTGAWHPPFPCLGAGEVYYFNTATGATSWEAPHPPAQQQWPEEAGGAGWEGPRLMPKSTGILEGVCASREPGAAAGPTHGSPACAAAGPTHGSPACAAAGPTHDSPASIVAMLRRSMQLVGAPAARRFDLSVPAWTCMSMPLQPAALTCRCPLGLVGAPAARRFDLHNAILFHGGYISVAEASDAGHLGLQPPTDLCCAWNAPARVGQPP